MKTINLYRNQIGAEGASSLAHALEVNTSVIFLLQCVARFIN
jgi:hypothetical protein